VSKQRICVFAGITCPEKERESARKSGRKGKKSVRERERKIEKDLCVYVCV